MTENLFTGTLSKNETKNETDMYIYSHGREAPWLKILSKTNLLSIWSFAASSVGFQRKTKSPPTVFNGWWPFQGHKNLFNSLLCFNDTIYKVWPESIIQFKRNNFGQNLKFLCADVTLKIRLRSPNSDQLFALSPQFICARLVKFHALVQEI